MIVKAFIIVIMILIVVTLGSGLFSLIRGNGDDNKTVKALSWRIGISLVLFLLLFVAFMFGWISPHGIG